MSIRPLEGDMATAADATLSKMHIKINELVVDANETLQAQLKMKNQIVDIIKEIRNIKLRLMNSNG